MYVHPRIWKLAWLWRVALTNTVTLRLKSEYSLLTHITFQVWRLINQNRISYFKTKTKQKKKQPLDSVVRTEPAPKAAVSVAKKNSQGNQQCLAEGCELVLLEISHSYLLEHHRVVARFHLKSRVSVMVKFPAASPLIKSRAPLQ